MQALWANRMPSARRAGTAFALDGTHAVLRAAPFSLPGVEIMTMRKVAIPVLLLAALSGFAGCEKRPAETMPQTSPSTGTAPTAPASAASQ
jgi:hypothetical protein